MHIKSSGAPLTMTIECHWVHEQEREREREPKKVVDIIMYTILNRLLYCPTDFQLISELSVWRCYFFHSLLFSRICFLAHFHFEVAAAIVARIWNDRFPKLLWTVPFECIHIRVSRCTVMCLCLNCISWWNTRINEFMSMGCKMGYCALRIWPCNLSALIYFTFIRFFQ